MVFIGWSPRSKSIGAPETPPEPPFRIATLGRGSRLPDEPAEELPTQQWRRLDRRAYRSRLEHSRLHRHYFTLALFLQT
jgi:hypothetical protein